MELLYNSSKSNTGLSTNAQSHKIVDEIYGKLTTTFRDALLLRFQCLPDGFQALTSEYEDLHDPYIQQEPPSLPCADLFSCPSLLVTQIVVLSAIPSRPTVDSLVARLFSSADMPVSLTIYREQFFNQYVSFRENPNDTPIMWIAVLLGLLFIAAYETLVVAGSSSTLDEVTLLEDRNTIATSYERIIQCLRLGNYMSGGPHVIKALLFLLQLEFVQGEDRQHEMSVDVVLNVVGKPQFGELIEVLKGGGRYAVAGAIAGPVVELNVRILYLKNLRFFGCTYQNREVIANLVRYIEKGEIRPHVGRVFKLQDTEKAQRVFQSKAVAGKLVLEVD